MALSRNSLIDEGIGRPSVDETLSGGSVLINKGLAGDGESWDEPPRTGGGAEGHMSRRRGQEHCPGIGAE